MDSRVFKEIVSRRCGVQDVLEKLRRIDSNVQAVLFDAEEKCPESNHVRLWLRELREAFYEADHLLDDFSTEANHQQVIPGYRVCMKVCFYGLKMDQKTEDARNRVNEIAGSRKFYLNDGSMGRLFVDMNREKPRSFGSEIVAGMEDDKWVVAEISLFLDCEENARVVPIIGMGGLGKMILTQFVFDNDINLIVE